jgi:Fic family protein
MRDSKSKKILEFIKKNSLVSSKQIYDEIQLNVGYATLKRILTKLLSENLITTEGKGRGTKYRVSVGYELLFPLSLNEYFEKEVDERDIKSSYNFSLITDVLSNVTLFNPEELEHLTHLQNTFSRKSQELTEAGFKKEMERLAIDLIWKSSQIEGNTYSLLETERLLKEKETAQGKTRDEATMLLNHKDALDFVVNNPDYIEPLTIARIEDIHSILIKELGVERNIRRSRVGISGTNYKPLDNEYQIKEAIEEMCKLINHRKLVFEKALLLLILLSYIQPFNDGNKRTARIISNAILIKNQYCPISFRTVDSIEYKKAMLLFYEQNNITAFKDIFINEFEFAVNTYF